MVMVTGADGKQHDIAAKITAEPAPSIAELCAQHGIKLASKAELSSRQRGNLGAGEARRTFYFNRASQPSEFKAAIAEGTLADASRELGISRPVLQWVMPASPASYGLKVTLPMPYEQLDAYTDGDVVCVRADLDLDAVKRVVWHEARHAYHAFWATKHGVARPSYQAEEDDCAAYATGKLRWR